MDFLADNSMILADSPHTAEVPGFPPVPALYSAPFKTAGLYDGQVETTDPIVIMLSTDAAEREIEHGTVLTVYYTGAVAGEFSVIGIEPDGLGLTHLVLTNNID